MLDIYTVIFPSHALPAASMQPHPTDLSLAVLFHDSSACVFYITIRIEDEILANEQPCDGTTQTPNRW
jgi:hypothetical protein